MLMQKCLLPVKVCMFTDTNEVKAVLTRFTLKNAEIFILASCSIQPQTISAAVSSEPASSTALKLHSPGGLVLQTVSISTSFNPCIFPSHRNWTTNVRASFPKTGQYPDFLWGPK